MVEAAVGIFLIGPVMSQHNYGRAVVFSYSFSYKKKNTHTLKS